MFESKMFKYNESDMLAKFCESNHLIIRIYYKKYI